jgi:thiol-disulfide isomerase/thioredoxin
VGVVVLLILLLSTGGGSPNEIKTDAGLITIPVGERQELPEITGSTLTGTRLSLESFRGQAVVLNVWGSWCAPCRREAPELARAADVLGRKAAFVGYNIEDNAAAAAAFMRENRQQYPSFFDQDGSGLLALKRIAPGLFTPSTLVIDADGLVAAVIYGATSERTLTTLVREVLQDGALPAVPRDPSDPGPRLS